MNIELRGLSMKRSPPARYDSARRMLLALALGIAAFGVSADPPAAGAATAPKDRTIGYVMSSLYWAIYQTPAGKTECPKGFNDGPREQYAALFPNNGKKRTVLDTQLKLETETWFPSTLPDPTPFHEATGAISYGMNLDGKIGIHDFTSPDGERGIDNQLFRALGCIIGFRGPDGIEYIFEPKEIRDSRFDRTMIELKGVDDLLNDDDVQVTIYRGLDRLLTDATGNEVMPGGSQRIDARWGKRFIKQLRGKIVDGVLTTEPVDEIVIPWTTLDAPAIVIIRDARLRLKLTPTAAEGLIGGYADVDTWYRWLLRNDSTHHLSNGQISGISLYRALRRLADAHPDPKTGANTAISSALNAKFVQAFIQHPQADAVKADPLRADTRR
jgi:hypothetical protein